jgi:hypothetical protein
LKGEYSESENFKGHHCLRAEDPRLRLGVRVDASESKFKS